MLMPAAEIVLVTFASRPGCRTECTRTADLAAERSFSVAPTRRRCGGPDRARRSWRSPRRGPSRRARASRSPRHRHPATALQQRPKRTSTSAWPLTRMPTGKLGVTRSGARRGGAWIRSWTGRPSTAGLLSRAACALDPLRRRGISGRSSRRRRDRRQSRSRRESRPAPLSRELAPSRCKLLEREPRACAALAFEDVPTELPGCARVLGARTAWRMRLRAPCPSDDELEPVLAGILVLALVLDHLDGVPVREHGDVTAPSCRSPWHRRTGRRPRCGSRRRSPSASSPRQVDDVAASA